MEDLKHWEIKADESRGIFWLIINKEGSSVNSINRSVLKELETVLDSLVNDKKFNAVVIRSGKKTGFVAGADLQQLSDLESSTAIDVAKDMIAMGQRVFNKLEALEHTTISLIEGFCLGGGLEMALACDYRIARDDDKTKLGLPEIMLGIHPGWGGTVRLPKLTGITAAMGLILTGRAVSAKAAKKMGFVDAVVPDRHLDAAVTDFVTRKPKKAGESRLQKLLQSEIARPALSWILKRKTASKVKKEHYPAPFSVISTWRKYGCYNEKSLYHEMQSFENMLSTGTAKNLLRVFGLREKLKSLAKNADVDIKHVHVIGAGVMGGDIAAWCALRGYRVTLQDQNVEAIATSFKRAGKLFTKKLKQKHKIQAAKDRLAPDVAGLGVSVADVVIEAIVENKEIKSNLFAELETKAKPTAILATNTSTIPLRDIGEKMSNPNRLVGIHFFNPVPMMPLVEVVHENETEQDVVDAALAFVGKIDKLPLPVKSAPGFLVNRVLVPYLLESVSLYEEGVPPAVIDKVAVDFGMPMGPVELADTVGLDVCKAAAQGLGESVPKVVDALIAAGHLGKKTGQGFYKYKKGKAVKNKSDYSQQGTKDMTDRMVMRMINESVACLREGIVADKDLLDAGMIFGTGFAPFRGGPMQYVTDEEVKNIRERLEALAMRYGDRFVADEGWAA